MYARQAITTKYLGPTNTRGARVKATADAGSITVAWDHSLDAVPNHAAAATALVAKLGWGGTWYIGGTGNGYVFVNGMPDTVAIHGAEESYVARRLEELAAEDEKN